MLPFILDKLLSPDVNILLKIIKRRGCFLQKKIGTNFVLEQIDTALLTSVEFLQLTVSSVSSAEYLGHRLRPLTNFCATKWLTDHGGGGEGKENVLFKSRSFLPLVHFRFH